MGVAYKYHEAPMRYILVEVMEAVGRQFLKAASQVMILYKSNYF